MDSRLFFLWAQVYCAEENFKGDSIPTKFDSFITIMFAKYETLWQYLENTSLY